MLNKISKIGLGVVIAGAFATHALADQKSLKNEVRTQAYDMLDSQSVTIEFDKSQDGISQDAKGKIRSQLDALKGESKVETVHVAVWGSHDFVSEEFRNETSKDREEDLVDKRIDRVENALDEISSELDVEGYNMAERPNWFEKTFNLDDAKLKNAMRNKADRERAFGDKDDRKLQKLAQIFSDKGGANKAVIVFETKSTSNVSH